jgi:hypothetical protein
LPVSPTQRRPPAAPIPQNSELQFRQVPQPLGGRDAALFVVEAMSRIPAQFDATMIAASGGTSKKQDFGRRAFP